MQINSHLNHPLFQLGLDESTVFSFVRLIVSGKHWDQNLILD